MNSDAYYYSAESSEADDIDVFGGIELRKTSPALWSDDVLRENLYWARAWRGLEHEGARIFRELQQGASKPSDRPGLAHRLIHGFLALPQPHHTARVRRQVMGNLNQMKYVWAKAQWAIAAKGMEDDERRIEERPDLMWRPGYPHDWYLGEKPCPCGTIGWSSSDTPDTEEDLVSMPPPSALATGLGYQESGDAPSSGDEMSDATISHLSTQMRG
ncbi:hypothetical protein PVAG01_03953 [Phlyctema vagabunda]|uniref:Uncharacterized protein n=1 Tax=Phlyctema vagabunda TaxID=108571 RepID=A0ABR4PNJ2_9HELO